MKELRAGWGMVFKKTKRLNKKRIKQSLETISRFSNIINEAGLEKVLAIGTAALRQAENSDALIKPAEEILNTKIRILSGEEEGDLVARGLISNIPLANGIIADLGGGSLELIKVQNGKKIETISLNYGHLIEIDEKKFKKIRKCFRKLFEELFENFSFVSFARKFLSK